MYGNIGSVHDCLVKCGQSIPVRYGKTSPAPELSELYEERHKYLHKILVPAAMCDGAAVLQRDVQVMDSNHMRWTYSGDNIEYVDVVLDETRSKFLRACQCSWARLLEAAGAPEASAEGSVKAADSLYVPFPGALSGMKEVKQESPSERGRMGS